MSLLIQDEEQEKAAESLCPTQGDASENLIVICKATGRGPRFSVEMQLKLGSARWCFGVLQKESAVGSSFKELRVGVLHLIRTADLNAIGAQLLTRTDPLSSRCGTSENMVTLICGLSKMVCDEAK